MRRSIQNCSYGEQPIRAICLDTTTLDVRCGGRIECLPAAVAINMAALGEKLRRRTKPASPWTLFTRTQGSAKATYGSSNRGVAKTVAVTGQASGVASALNIDVAFFMDDGIEDLQRI